MDGGRGGEAGQRAGRGKRAWGVTVGQQWAKLLEFCFFCKQGSDM